MAFLAKQFSLFLLLISLLCSHARDIQFFSKTPTATHTNNVVQNKPQEQEEYPNFVLQDNDNENSYGLYGQETVDTQIPPPPATTTHVPSPPYRPWNYRTDSYVTDPNHSPTTFVPSAKETDTIDHSTALAEEKSQTENPSTIVDNYKTYNYKDATPTLPSPPYRPWNYRTDSYVTSPYVRPAEEDTFDHSTTLAEGKVDNYYNNEEDSVQNSPHQEKDEYNNRYDRTTAAANNNNNLYNSQAQGYTNNNNDMDNSERSSMYSQPQGMSDTRSVQGGMYHYDSKTGQFNQQHPYQYYNYHRNYENTNRYQEEDQSLQDEGMP